LPGIYEGEYIKLNSLTPAQKNGYGRTSNKTPVGNNQRMRFVVIKLLIILISSNLLDSCIVFQDHAVGYAVANQVDLTGSSKKAILLKYGWPKKSETINSDESRDVYIYEEEHWGRMYVYFKDGIVTSTRYEKIRW
jgi:hypothetical protein